MSSSLLSKLGSPPLTSTLNSYSAGSKDGAISVGLYDGNGPIVRSGGNVIVVTFNYRVNVTASTYYTY
jgi:hypothetical protein